MGESWAHTDKYVSLIAVNMNVCILDGELMLFLLLGALPVIGQFSAKSGSNEVVFLGFQCFFLVACHDSI